MMMMMPHHDLLSREEHVTILGAARTAHINPAHQPSTALPPT